MHRLRVLLLVTASATAAGAQPSHPTPHFASRATLEARAAAAESASAAATAEPLREAKRAEAWLLRERLRVGDFHPGDRIALTVEGHPTLTDTLTVRTGRVVSLPDLGDIALTGILRAELDDHLTREIGRYLRDPKIRAIPLMRVAVLGQVARPGYYALPADALLSDAVMGAGGPSPQADLAKSTVRRGTERLLRDRDVSVALSDGITLDQLDIRSGDEIIVGEKKRFDASTAIQLVSVGTSVIIGLVAVFGRR
jgi:protein involved in polysaccharide export with SLBB domain